MYQALYRTCRPEVFSDVLGQEHIVKILRNQLATDTVNHAYLFCGTRGTGKTTMARLLAKGVNCLAEMDRPCGECEHCRSIKEGSFMDLIEIDAASNNGVENIRELRESVNYAPAVGRKKVYIIDEVHMLSAGAYNALLKTLEEPPEDIMFILCTTEPEKLPATILSRCVRMDFRRVAESEMADYFSSICRQRGVDMEEDALGHVVVQADGSVRDGLTILDQCIAGRSGRITRDDVLDALGAVGAESYLELTEYALAHDATGGLALIDRLMQSGRDARQILQGWMSHYRNLMLARFVSNPADLLSMSLEQVERVQEQSRSMDMEVIHQSITEIARTVGECRTSTQPRILLEVCFVKLADIKESDAPVRPPRVKPMAVKKEVPQEQKESSEIPPAVSSDIQEIWEEVLARGIDQRPDFTLVKSGAVPVKMNDDEFVISARGMAANFIDQNTEMVAELVAHCSGGPKLLKIIDGDDEEAVQSGAEDLAARVGQVFGGIDVEIE